MSMKLYMHLCAVHQTITSHRIRVFEDGLLGHSSCNLKLKGKERNVGWTKWSAMVKRKAMLLISILRRGFSGIRKAVYSSVKCFVNCVLDTKWAVSICNGPWSHKNELFLNSHAWPGNCLIRDKSQLLLISFLRRIRHQSMQVISCYSG